jgi:signal transduction histidine kinase
MRLFAFDLDGEALAQIGTRMEVRAWLREWTGVSIYRDGFRLWPFGEPHDDWLRLDQRRVNSPVDHLSNNQVIGFIEIGRDTNPGLMDQTNREGLIHTDAVDDLRRLVLFVLQFLEAERQSIRHPVGNGFARKVIVAKSGKSIPDELDRLAGQANGKLGQTLKRLGRQLRDKEKAETEHALHALEGYIGLAAAGQMASGLALLIPSDIRLLRSEMDRLREVLSRKKTPEAREALDKMSTLLDSLTQYQRMLVAAAGQTERNRTIDVAAELDSFGELYRPVLVARGALIDVQHSSAELLRAEMRSEGFLCILQALTMNALEATQRIDEPRIRVQAAAVPEGCEVIFSDNGPGVTLENSPRIFNPRFTTKEGHLGMGLTIARQMIESHGGTLDLLIDGRRKGPASGSSCRANARGRRFMGGMGCDDERSCRSGFVGWVSRRAGTPTLQIPSKNRAAANCEKSGPSIQALVGSEVSTHPARRTSS